MKFNLVGGRGKFTRLFVPVFRKAGHRVIVTGRTSDPSPVEAAIECDLTIVSVPIPVTERVIREVAPYAPAIMDLTSVKTLPMRWMMKYTGLETEVCGLHPDFGVVKNIHGRRILCCETDRTGERCEEGLDALKKGGAIIEKVTPRQNDLKVNGYSTYARYLTICSYMKFLSNHYGTNLRDFYNNWATALTRPLLNLAARQAAVENDLLFSSMRQYNPFAEDIGEQFLEAARDVVRRGMKGRDMRCMYGRDMLKRCQKSSAKIVNLTPKRI